MNNIIEIIASLTESYIVVRFVVGFLGLKNEEYSFLKSLTAFLLLALDNVLLSQLDGFENLSVILLAVIILAFSQLFLKGKIYEKLLVSIFPIVIMLPINMITINAFKAFSGCEQAELVTPGGGLRFSVLLITKTVFYFTSQFIVKLRYKSKYSLDTFQWMIQLLCFLVSSVISISLWNISRNTELADDQFLLTYIMIAALNILLFLMVKKMKHDSSIQEEYRISKINLAAQEQLVTEARERYSEISTLRHDMKHCLTAAAELLERGDSDSAKRYIEKVLKERVDNYAALITTGNAIIDAVINNKLAACTERGINTKCRIDTAMGEIDEVDMSILLSNLLDNAIRGCEDVEAPSIEILITRQKSYLFISLKNSINSSVLAKNPTLNTSKTDKTVHGLGIKSIRDIAEKYSGTSDFLEENGFFVAEIWLNLEI